MISSKCTNWECKLKIDNLKEKNAAYKTEIKSLKDEVKLLKREKKLLIKEYETPTIESESTDLDKKFNKVLKEGGYL